MFIMLDSESCFVEGDNMQTVFETEKEANVAAKKYLLQFPEEKITVYELRKYSFLTYELKAVCAE